MVDDREIRSDSPSYSLLTLESLRAELGPEKPICMVMGMDAYHGLPGWHQWERLLELGHIIVVGRPGYRFAPDAALEAFTQKHRTEQMAEVRLQPAGRVLIHELTPLGISATRIRQLIARGESPRYLLPGCGLGPYPEQRPLRLQTLIFQRKKVLITRCRPIS